MSRHEYEKHLTAGNRKYNLKQLDKAEKAYNKTIYGKYGEVGNSWYGNKWTDAKLAREIEESSGTRLRALKRIQRCRAKVEYRPSNSSVLGVHTDRPWFYKGSWLW